MQLAGSGVFLGVTFFLLLFLILIHRDWHDKDHASRGQLFWLAGLSNVLGSGLLIGFVLIVKGGL